MGLKWTSIKKPLRNWCQKLLLGRPVSAEGLWWKGDTCSSFHTLFTVFIPCYKRWKDSVLAICVVLPYTICYLWLLAWLSHFSLCELKSSPPQSGIHDRLFKVGLCSTLLSTILLLSSFASYHFRICNYVYCLFIVCTCIDDHLLKICLPLILSS